MLRKAAQNNIPACPIQVFQVSALNYSSLKAIIINRKLLRLIVASALLSLTVNALAVPKTGRSKQKEAAESERAELRQQLAVLKRSIDQTESAHGEAADALATSESAISKANRALHELALEQQQTQNHLRQLTQQHTALEATVNIQQKQLAKLLRGQYASGSEDRLKLLLSGDNPNRINRDLHYFGYVSQAQATLIESLRANLQAVERNQTETLSTKADLDEITVEQQAQKTALENQKTQRAALLAQLSEKLSSQRKQAGNLTRDEHRLGQLVTQLGRLIEEQKKADAVAREKRAQEQLARERAAKQQQQRRAAAATEKHPTEVAKAPSASTSQSANPDAIDDDEPPSQAVARNELTPHAETTPGRAFASLRGSLHLPLAGDIVARFGSPRGDAPNWKGLFIRAAASTPVKSVAAGRVVFADWLRGFGNLIIVDHGNQYMTIYGNNQALLKRPGDQVQSGDVIASAGNTGGNQESGLYFEMRFQGRAFDPLGWVTTR